MTENTFEVTQTMLDSAQETYDHHAEKGQYCHFGPLQYAIEVAIQTSGLVERILAVESTLAAIHAICLETGPRWTADETVAKITQLVEAGDGD